jgi:hypothetical protein
MSVTDKPGFPCRVSLEDREVGDSVLLLNHVSHDVSNPYRASHAIFIAENAMEAAQFVDRVPPVFESRILSLRAFDAEGMMREATLVHGAEADAAIRGLLADAAIQTVHVHNAVRGCFAAVVERS